MDLNDLRGILTAVLLFAFVGVWIWAFSRRRKPEFDAAAGLPLEEDRGIAPGDEEICK